MAEAIAIAANPAAPAAKQIKDHDNDEDRSKRHGAPPLKGRLADVPPANRIRRTTYPACRFQPRNPIFGGPRGRLFRIELQRRRIDAVTQSGRPRAVLEHMAEMTIAARAQHFGADHAVAHVAFLVDTAFGCRLGEARPAAAGIELGIGLEQRLSAAGADIGARAMLMLVFAGEGPFGRLLAQHRVLHRRQFLAPLGFALFDLWRRLGVRHETSFAAIAPSVSDFDITDQSGLLAIVLGEK